MINKKKNIYFFFLILVIIYGIYCSLAIGKTWDTFFFINIGKERLSYLFSFGTNEISEKLIEQLYPAIYNTLSAFIGVSPSTAPAFTSVESLIFNCRYGVNICGI